MAIVKNSVMMTGQRKALILIQSKIHSSQDESQLIEETLAAIQAQVRLALLQIANVIDSGGHCNHRSAYGARSGNVCGSVSYYENCGRRGIIARSSASVPQSLRAFNGVAKDIHPQFLRGMAKRSK